MNDLKTRKWYFVCDVNSIPVKEGRRVARGSHEVALFHLENRFLAVDNQCPHKQGPLADGIVAGDAVFCPLHTLKISLETGCALNGGEGQVKKYPVRMHEDKVYIAFDEGVLTSPSCP